MKHFHGRRHVRAQKTVRIGRDRKRQRKQADWQMFIVSLYSACENAVQTMSNAIENMSKRIIDIMNDFKNGTGEQNPVGLLSEKDFR